ncbi:hypothetical protein [Kineosporia babensis]|uniref:Saccharopine dehydrogenase n=1 Tax=Kineosporia babensis TaxID=499548 RepID=A0A9X1NKM2_9ACTN|nr:hypothetical protein [Kineosporia babensis]MCD5316697.1 hypothetical protein [Kineosporia babensis]
MRALILDGPGDLGRATARELAGMGVEAVLAGRDPIQYEQAVNLRGDLADLYRAAGQVAVVVNVSGVTDPRLAERAAAASAAFVEIGDMVLPAHPRTPVLAGARLIPLLAGVLARDAVAGAVGLGVMEPVQIGVVLGVGDPQSAADLGSTYALLGTYFTDPATGEEVLNFSDAQKLALPDGRWRSFLRVDFPGQQMLTAGLGRPVRTYLATGDRFSTALLQRLTRVRGAAGLPSALHLPGKPGWQVFARAGQSLSWAGGQRQAGYAARIVAIATRRAPTLEPGLHRIQDLLTLSELGDLDGLSSGRSVLGAPQS